MGLLHVMIALSLVRGTEPDTQCETCWQAEADIGWKAARALGVGGPRLRGFLDMSGILGAALGYPTTWYDRHRADWVAHGRPLDLTRMLRHVDNQQLLADTLELWR